MRWDNEDFFLSRSGKPIIRPRRGPLSIRSGRSRRSMVSQRSRINEPSRLLMLPWELRDEIWTIFFNSTRLSFGLRYTPRHGERLVRPAPNSLAILRVCQQIYEETYDMWIQRVLFNFEDPQTMLNRLSELPDHTVAKIRHLRLCGSPMMRYLKGFDDLMYRQESIFHLVPALRLDCLTVLAIAPAAPEYDAITNLVNRGNGWKELRYITLSSRMLGFGPSRSHAARDTGDIRRQPQPRFWNKKLLNRDGEDSGASVQIYRTKEEDHPESLFEPDGCDLFEQTPDEHELSQFGLADDEQLTRGPGARRALLVSVKRGDDADVTQKSPGYGKERDMKARFNKRNWRARKKVIVWTPLDAENDDDFGNGWARPQLRRAAQAFDVYHDINDMFA